MLVVIRWFGLAMLGDRGGSEMVLGFVEERWG